MKLRITLLAIAIQFLVISAPGSANAAIIAISPYYAIVDNGNNGGGSGTNVNVGGNCDAKGVCQGSWWKYGTFLGS